MLRQLLFWKPGPPPYLSFALVLACLVVSLPIHFLPRLYNVFGGLPRYYPWQFLTSVFAHGSYLGPLPLLLHLAGNVALILFFGGAVERVVGTRRFAFLTGAALLVHLILRVAVDGWGNGASGIAWAYTPFAFYLLVAARRHDRTRFWRDPTTYLYLCLLVLAWIVVTILSHQMHMTLTNLYHLVATGVGVAFLLSWRRILNAGPDGAAALHHPMDPADRRIVRTAILIPLGSLAILVLTLAGVIPDHTSPASASILPASGSVRQINEAGGQIVVRFSEPMRRDRLGAQTSIFARDDLGALGRRTYWGDDQTLIFAFGRNFGPGESISIRLFGLVDGAGRRLFEEFRLEYGPYEPDEGTQGATGRPEQNAPAG